MRIFAAGRLSLVAMTAAGWCATDISAAKPATDAVKLAQVLGQRGADGWIITPAKVALSGEPALVAAAPGMTLESKASQAAPGEYFFAFRLRPAKGALANVNLQMACGPRPDKATVP
jgi:hypothetical protein